MPSKKCSATPHVLAILIVALALSEWMTAQTESVTYNFSGYSGYYFGPNAGLAFDSEGNLYGTTSLGGTSNCGRVFELTPQTNGAWTEKVLHNFTGKDGCAAYGNLILDSKGNLYGTTNVGGAFNDGVVFELRHSAGGGWVEQVLHSFNRNGVDGYGPSAGLVFDSFGNLYGTTTLGGTNGAVGTVFELSPGTNGIWTETPLYAFNSLDGKNGAYPLAGVIFGSSGRIFGTAAHGGANNNNWGVVFELTPQSGGWTETVLHTFQNNGVDGSGPAAGLISDSAGNLYGTTNDGGTGPCNFEGVLGCGTVFELSPQTGGGWEEAVLYSFQGGTDGEYPRASLILDAAGDLYGTTQEGGAYGSGTVFELTPLQGGVWTERVMHSFGKNEDGLIPEAGLVLDSAGNLYGTTEFGGVHGAGTVFRLVP